MLKARKLLKNNNLDGKIMGTSCQTLQKCQKLLTKGEIGDIIIKLSGTESAEEENIKSFLKKVLDKLKTV